MSFFELVTDRVVVVKCSEGGTELLIEGSGVSITLLGGIIGHPTCRT
ncbi:hypothetical protein ACFCXK_02620 [Streptomyces sp. NPDC056269]